MANLVSGSFKSTNVNDGADARLLMLEASGNVIGFDAEGKAVPGQKVDIVAYIQNIEGSPIFTAIPYVGETAQTPITLKGSGNARYITGEEWNKDWNRLIVSVSLAGFTDSTTIAKVQDGSGKDGQNAIVGLLTNEAITLSADENGNIPDFSTATGEFQIYDGLTKVTEGVSFAISGQVGASGTINQNGVYNVTAMTADTATIEFKATYKGTEIFKKLSLAKSRKGQPGKNANLLYLSVSNNVIVFDANDVAFPNQRISIVAKLQNISGTAAFKAIPYINATAQSEIALSGSGNDRYISGENWDKRWTSLSVTATIGGLSDQTTIYKISEVKGSDGKNTIIGILTNESITISADANGNVPDFTKATGTFQIYDGIALVDPKNVTYAVQTQTGATATIGTNGVYRVTAMSADTATVVFKATYGGVERTKQLSIAKSKAGQKGEAGNGIKSTKTQYQRSANGQTPPTGTWLDEIPVVPPGEFLWTRVTQTFDDDTTSVSYSVSKMGEDGEKGKDSYVHTMFANDIDFGDYDYSGNPNLMTVLKASDFLTQSGATIEDFNGGLKVTFTKTDGATFLESRKNIPALLSNKQYTLSADVTVSDGYTGKLDNLRFGYRKWPTGTIILPLTAKDAQVGKKTKIFITANSSSVTDPSIFDRMYFTIHTTSTEPFVGTVLIENIKVEEGTTATPYQPNILEEPYQISHEPLGKNILKPSTFPIENSEYMVASFIPDEPYIEGQTYTFTMEATKPPTQTFGIYLRAGSLGAGNMKPVEGLTDVWQVTFTPNKDHINGGANGLNVFQLPSTTKGKVKIKWAKLEKGGTRTPNIDAFKYVGFYTGELAEAPTDPTMYKWNKIKGEDGVGLESTEIFYVGSTNGQTPPDSGWQTTVPNVPQGQYMWTKVVWTYSDDSIKTAYSVGKIGANGTNGNDGLPGKDGVGIDDTLIEYAVSTSGTVRPTSGWSTNTPSVPQGQYLWTRITWTYTDKTTEQGYIVARQGANGKDGVSVKTITTTYQAGTSGTTPPTGAWLPTPPTVAENQFLWTKIEISLDNGTKSTGYSVGKMGAQGQPGEKGDPGAPGTPGNGIKSSSVTYQVSTSGTTTPTGTWVSTPPAVPQGQYLWTRTVLTFDNGQSVTAYAVSKAGIDGENGLNNDNMVFNNRFEKFNEWPQNSMGWYKTQFTQATQPETDKPTNNILKIGGDASSASRYTFSRNIAVVPGTTIELSFDAKLSRLFTSKGIANIRMFDAEHANSVNQTVGGNSYINLFTDGTASAGAGVTEYDGKNTPITTANTWYRYKVRFLVPDNVTNVKMFFITTDPNASSFLFVRDPQGVIYKDLNANTRNFALDSRFPSAKTIGATTTRRKNIQLSRPTKAGEKYTIALDYSLISGTLTSQIQVVLADKNEAGKGNVLLNTSGNKNRLVGEITATGEADHLQIFHGVNGATTEATNYEFEKIMFNLGDKTFDYEQAPEDGFSTTNVWPNSSWNIGKGAWVFTDDQFEILAPETDKPESSILHGKPINLSFQQAYQMPHPRFVNAGDIVHVSFDYKEKNRTKDTLLAIIRIFPEKDTANSGANALAEKPIKPSVLGWSLANNTDWVNVDYVFRSTVSGWLEVLMYDDDVTGNHESFYREIFVTNAGKLHGEWSPAQVDFATQIDGIPKVFVQANMPTDPSIKNGDQWWVQSGNKVTSIKVYGNGAWHDQAIDQAVLNIVQLNAVNINGSIVNGSQFINTFDIKDSDHSKMKGTTKIQDGFIMQDVENIGLDASGEETKKFLESHLRLSYGSFLSQSTLFDDQGNQTSNSSSNLTGGYLNLTLKDSSGTYNGTLDAKSLTNTGWKTLRLNSKMDIAEGNPPQYRIFYQLDGSKLIKFRGQVKMKSGKMLRTKTYYPFQNGDPTATSTSTENYVPEEIRPDRTAFGYGAGPNAGGRIAATTTPRIVINPAEDGDYFSIEAFQYIKD